MTVNRRGFVAGLAAGLIAAPAIIPVRHLMKLPRMPWNPYAVDASIAIIDPASELPLQWSLTYVVHRDRWTLLS